MRGPTTKRWWWRMHDETKPKPKRKKKNRKTFTWFLLLLTDFFYGCLQIVRLVCFVFRVNRKCDVWVCCAVPFTAARFFPELQQIAGKQAAVAAVVPSNRVARSLLCTNLSVEVHQMPQSVDFLAFYLFSLLFRILLFFQNNKRNTRNGNCSCFARISVLCQPNWLFSHFVLIER